MADVVDARSQGGLLAGHHLGFGVGLGIAGEQQRNRAVGDPQAEGVAVEVPGEARRVHHLHEQRATLVRSPARGCS